MEKKYSIIDHTADIGLDIKTGSVEELFETAAEGMFHILTDLDRIDPDKEIEITLTADSYENLLIYWLQELLYHFSVYHTLFSNFSVSITKEEDNSYNISAGCAGESIDLTKHEIKCEIKTATYHQLSVKQVSAEWQGRVIFDI